MGQWKHLYEAIEGKGAMNFVLPRYSLPHCLVASFDSIELMARGSAATSSRSVRRAMAWLTASASGPKRSRCTMTWVAPSFLIASTAQSRGKNQDEPARRR